MQASFAKKYRLEPAQLKLLSQKSDRKACLQVGSHLAALAINTLLLAQAWGSVWAIPLFATQGILINCLYAGVHELSHNTVFKRRALNEWFGRLFAFLLLMGRDQDRFEHYHHHRHTQDPDKDAEIVGGKPFTLSSYLLYISGISYWPYRIGEVVRLALGHTEGWPHLSQQQLQKVHFEARMMIIGYLAIALASLILQSAWVLYLWLLPMFSMKWFQMLQNTVEHTGMPFQQDIMQNTRTVRAGPLMRWLFWNMPFHTAHHSYPMVPFHRLAELHAALLAKMDGKEPATIGHFEFQKQMLKKLKRENSSEYSGKDISAY